MSTDPLLSTPLLTALLPILLTGVPGVYLATKYLITLLADAGHEASRGDKRLLALLAGLGYTALYWAFGGLRGGVFDTVPFPLVFLVTAVGLAVTAGGFKDDRDGTKEQA
ncbi:hypothetical protein [Deinococcus sp. S9]|uniref:hypothetical protein n=1 Tax=Deinococcus sp. S9 TaxID=2545754 RepID=UPI0010561E2F|nr:hypothetical protein [Deinococcus sp. S9]TDE87342.1 hypothetical protein E0686_02280 [Deinococcus sp. S9]